MLLGLLTLSACTCTPTTAGADRPDVVLVIVDTLRADHMHFAGHERPTTPNLDALVTEATWFSRAYAGSSWTLPSTATLFTGVDPSVHRVVRDYRDPLLFGRLDDRFVTLAEHFQALDYRTAAFINNAFMAPEFNLHQGFDLYDYQGAGLTDHRTAHETFAAGLKWLADDEKPALLVLHVMEPHADYQIAEPWAGTFTEGMPHKRSVPLGEDMVTRLVQQTVVPPVEDQLYLAAAYDEEILQVDHALGELVTALRTRPNWEHTVLAVTADHGEEFWDWGRYEHGHSLHSVVTQVPLILRAPGLQPGPVSTVVGHPDLFQALTTRSGSLWESAASGQAEPGRAVISENILYGPQAISMITDDRRLTVTIPPDGSQSVASLWEVDEQGWEGEDLSQDPANRSEAVTHARRLEELRGSLAPIVAASTMAIPSPETFDKLRALGYIE